MREVSLTVVIDPHAAQWCSACRGKFFMGVCGDRRDEFCRSRGCFSLGRESCWSMCESGDVRLDHRLAVDAEVVP